jgi:hypothetical protein
MADCFKVGSRDALQEILDIWNGSFVVAEEIRIDFCSVPVDDVDCMI